MPREAASAPGSGEVNGSGELAGLGFCGVASVAVGTSKLVGKWHSPIKKAARGASDRLTDTLARLFSD